MGNVLALAAALAYGVSHLLGGLVSRRGSAVAAAALSQIAGLVAVLCVAPLVSGEVASLPGLGWGALSGVGTGLAVVWLYHGFSVGRMSVVSPLSEVAAIAVPVLVGFTLGELPTALALTGVTISFPVIWLVSRGTDANPSPSEKARSSSRASGALSGMLAGAGFALQFIALAQVPPGTGLWPFVANRVVAVTITGTWALMATRHSLSLPPGSIGIVAVAGIIGTLGSVLYMLATRQQLLGLAVVLASLYPVIPVVAGRFMLRERIIPIQKLGLGLAAIAVVFIILG